MTAVTVVVAGNSFVLLVAFVEVDLDVVAFDLVVLLVLDSVTVTTFVKVEVERLLLADTVIVSVTVTT